MIRGRIARSEQQRGCECGVPGAGRGARQPLPHGATGSNKQSHSRNGTSSAVVGSRRLNTHHVDKTEVGASWDRAYRNEHNLLAVFSGLVERDLSRQSVCTLKVHGNNALTVDEHSELLGVARCLRLLDSRIANHAARPHDGGLITWLRVAPRPATVVCGTICGAALR